MAWRETRGAWHRFLGLFGCVALGVATLVGVGSFAAALERALGREAKALMGGDLELRSSRPLGPAIDERLDRLRARGASVARVRELVGMARPATSDQAILVELKAVDAAYPLYGRLQTRDGTGTLAETDVWVHDSLLTRLGVRVGDRVRIGSAEFRIADVIAKEPDRSATMFTLGPRVLLSAAGLEQTGLVQYGSRVRHRTLVRLPESLDGAEARRGLVRELGDPTVRVTSFDEAQPGLRRFYDQLTTYLGLVGLASLLVGGIGVAAGVQSYIRRKHQTIAVLKALGATGPILLRVYLLQAVALGGLGSLVGVALGRAVLAALSPLLTGFVPFDLDVRLAPWTVAHGVAMGLLTTFLCALWPLLAIRAVPSVTILRDPGQKPWHRADAPWLVAGGIAAALAVLAIWQAGSITVGGLFVLAAGAALGLMAALAALVRHLARTLPRLPSLVWRQGLANLHRPGSQATVVIVSLGIGIMLLVAVAFLERSLARQLDHERRREAPSFFFIDIQPDQLVRFREVLSTASAGAGMPELTPIVRARLVAINGEPIRREDWDDREDAWRVTREYAVTAAATPPLGNVVVRGEWWGDADPASPRISVEDEAARALGVDVGGTLTFDIQGVRIEGRVESLRHVDWQTFSSNFFVIFSPGALGGAPTTYIATTRVPRAVETAVQDAVTAALPNVTAIPVRDILDRVSSVLAQLALAIRLIALFVVGAGLVVLAGVLAASRYQRLYESVLLRTVGASRGVVARAFAVEYGCLGAAAGLGGSLLGALLAWLLLRFLLEVPWTLEPEPLLAGIAGGCLLALAVGFLATYRLLGQKPLAVLRRE
jgi:putative ABC transport system permease protein